MSVQTTTLDNGCTLITESLPHTDSATLGFWIGRGARDEQDGAIGAAHMVEHMLFKGTSTRSAADISKQAEDMGAQLNAYTSRERTAYYMKCLNNDIYKGLSLLSDMVFNSILPDHEIERERGVILQEIGMYADTPDDHIFDVFQEKTYPDHKLGTPILGKVSDIEAMSKADLNNFITRNYTPENVTIVVVGNCLHKECSDFLNGHLPQLSRKGQDQNRSKPIFQDGVTRLDKTLEQAHLLIGFEGLSFTQDNHPALRVLSMALGGGMSSRLFQKIREEHGLAYSVYTYLSSYSDSGLFGVYAGLSADDIPRYIDLLSAEMHSKNLIFSAEEINRAKMQLKTGFLMSRESTYKRADFLGRYWASRQKLPDIKAELQRLEDVTQDQIHDLAADILTRAPSITALGPISSLQENTYLKESLVA